MTAETPTLPPVVYAPTLTGDDGNTRLRMHTLTDDKTALFVYSALDRFAAVYGPDASWVLLTVQDLQTAHDAVPYDVLFLDRSPQAAAAEGTAAGPGARDSEQEN